MTGIAVYYFVATRRAKKTHAFSIEINARRGRGTTVREQHFNPIQLISRSHQLKHHKTHNSKNRRRDLNGVYRASECE